MVATLSLESFFLALEGCSCCRVIWAVCATRPSTIFRTSPVLTDSSPTTPLPPQQLRALSSLFRFGNSFRLGDCFALLLHLHFLLRLHHLRLLGLHLFRRHVLFSSSAMPGGDILRILCGGPVGMFPFQRGHIRVADDLRRARNRLEGACTIASFFAPCRMDGPTDTFTSYRPAVMSLIVAGPWSRHHQR